MRPKKEEFTPLTADFATPLSDREPERDLPLTTTEVWEWAQFKKQLSTRVRPKARGLRGLRRITGTPTAPTRRLSLEHIPYKRALTPSTVVERLDYEAYERMWIQSSTRLAERAVRLPDWQRDPGSRPWYRVPPFSPELRKTMDKYPWIEWLPEGVTRNCSHGCTPYSTHVDYFSINRLPIIL